MKTFKIYPLIPAFLMSVASCNNEATLQDICGEQEISVKSRASETSPSEFSLYINQGDDAYNYDVIMSNLSGAWSAKSRSNPSESVSMKWKDASTSTNIVALYPELKVGDTNSFQSYSGLVYPSQTNETYLDKDVLYSNQTVTDKTNPLEVTFKHLLALIRIKAPDATKITFTNIKTKYTWNPSQGPTSLTAEVDEGNTNARNMVNLGDGTFEYLAPPQSLEGVTITVTYSAPQSTLGPVEFKRGSVLESGKVHTLEIGNSAARSGVTETRLSDGLTFEKKEWTD